MVAGRFLRAQCRTAGGPFPRRIIRPPLGGGTGMRPDATGVPAALPGGPRICDSCTYFNTAAFVQTPQYQFGNVSRYLPNVNNPTSWNVDTQLEKNTYIGESVHLTFRAESVQRAECGDLLRPDHEHHFLDLREDHPEPSQYAAAGAVQPEAGVLISRPVVLTRSIHASHRFVLIARIRRFRGGRHLRKRHGHYRRSRPSLTQRLSP